MFGRVDMRKRSLGALFPPHMGLLPAMDRERKEAQRLVFLDFHSYRRTEHRTDLFNCHIRGPLIVFEV